MVQSYEDNKQFLFFFFMEMQLFQISVHVGNIWKFVLILEGILQRRNESRKRIALTGVWCVQRKQTAYSRDSMV